MPDIRLVRPPGVRTWIWTGLLAAVGLLVWSSAFVVGDRTDPDVQPRVGANADFGAFRAPVLPARPAEFSSMDPLRTRDLGRLVHLQGTAGSPVIANAVWVRSDDGRRILVRFEPPPPESEIRGIGAGGRVDLRGYLQRIAVAEFEVWTDTLGVAIPRPAPGRKFGDLPDPSFARIDSLFIKDYYISVRPRALQPDDSAATQVAASTVE
ncbi:MAG TPA: hypothetical protein VFI91_13035 [Longimicrobiaceae bacterium]|nr:hypothetical protein [Longimicrobiaceae bacterium]